MMEHPPGLILIPVATISRYSAFHHCLATLERPDGTEVRFVQGQHIVSNLNRGLRQGYGEWVWLIADDHAFGPDMLMRLLDDNVDIVAPICTLKQFPFSITAFAGPHEPILPTNVHHDRLTEVWTCGSAGMLIRKNVLDKLGDPWFRNSSGDVLDEDIQFCVRARRKGFTVWLDARVQLGHIGSMTAWPIPTDDGDWEVHLDLWGDGGRVALEAPRPNIMRKK